MNIGEINITELLLQNKTGISIAKNIYRLEA